MDQLQISDEFNSAGKNANEKAFGLMDRKEEKKCQLETRRDVKTELQLKTRKIISRSASALSLLTTFYFSLSILSG